MTPQFNYQLISTILMNNFMFIISFNIMKHEYKQNQKESK